MSGGTHDYICFKIENELCNKMQDDLLNDLIADIASVAHDLEWWQSGDIDEESYRYTVDCFKRKWFDREDLIRTIRLVNPAEISKQIEKDNLSAWCVAMRINLRSLINVNKNDII